MRWRERAGLQFRTSERFEVTTVTDQAGHWRRSKADALGRLVEVDEPNPSGGADLVTLYQYNTLGNLTCAVQKGTDSGALTSCGAAPASWRPRSFVYDSLSRLTQAKNPESGQIDYTYDLNGNVLTKAAPLPNATSGSATVTTNYTYDALNRVLQKNFTGMTADTVNYSYDQGTYGKGHRSGMSDGSGSTTWAYEHPMGWVTTESRTIQGQSAPLTKQTQYYYNLDGSVQYMIYPSGRQVNYAYVPEAPTVPGVSAGRMVSAKEGTREYVSEAHYTPGGQPTVMSLGTNLNMLNTYNSRMQPISMAATTTANASAPLIFSLGYDFHLGNSQGQGNNGNVYGIVNNLHPDKTRHFTYDALNRLKQAWTDNWGESYGIDTWGNLTNIGNALRQDTGTCRQTPEPLNASPADTNNRLPGYYDIAGNMLGTTSAQYVYDAENRIATTASGYAYAYDGDGQRVKKTNGTTGTLYWAGSSSDALTESDLSGAVTNDYIFFNGKRVARLEGPVSSATPHYYLANHLGSVSVVVDNGGNLEHEYEYYPFGGAPPAPNDPNHYKFTGKERDTETNLDYFGARYYGSNIGRFMSADNFLNDTNVRNPQSWNLYTYVRNNPLRFVDPDGEMIYVGGLGSSDLDELLRRVNLTYGCNGCVSTNNGYLAVDTSGLSAAVLSASQYLTDAINSDTYFASVEVSNNSSEIGFGRTVPNGATVPWKGNRVRADLIRLDFGDDDKVTGDDDARSTFLNTVFAPEVAHRFPTVLSDPTSGGETGPVVDKVNKITDALGQPRRTEYGTRGSEFHSLRFSKKTVDNKGRLKEKEVQIQWSKRNVGGGGPN